MTAHHRTTDAPLDHARALAIRAMISHISAMLDPGTARTTFVAGQLLAQIDLAYPGAVQANEQHLTLTLYGTRTTALNSTIALLRNWQHAARIRLEAGGV